MAGDSGIEQLKRRSSIGWLRERDIDLLVCAEVHADGALRDKFRSFWCNPNLCFMGAWISLSEVDGETDLVIAFQSGTRWYILLVENKIAASFQPEQAARYADRAARWIKQQNVDVATVLVCPREYLTRPTTEQFNFVLPYEEMIETLRTSRDARSIYLAQALDDGIESYRRGYVAIPDMTVTSIWDAIWKMAMCEHPELNMEKPSDKPGKATWVIFRTPSGFTESDSKKCLIAYKAERGQVDLQFTSMAPGELEILIADVVESDMTVVKAGKSASLRVSVPTIDFTKDAFTQGENIREGLVQAERLRKLFVQGDIGERLKSRHPM